MGWGIGDAIQSVMGDRTETELAGDLKRDAAIKEQEMTPEEKALLASQMSLNNNMLGQYGTMQEKMAALEKMGPAVLAQMGYTKNRDGSLRPLTDAEAKSILTPDQYNIYQAKQQEAKALASGTLPDYIKREMDASNSGMLNAANQRLGPGGYYMSTPGENTTRLVSQNIADTAIKNRERQLGLLSGYYGLGANIGAAIPGFDKDMLTGRKAVLDSGSGLLTNSQSIAKNMIQPFHEWSSSNREKYSGTIGQLGSAGIGAKGNVWSSAMGLFKK